MSQGAFRILIVTGMALLIGGVFALDLHHWLSLDTLKAHHTLHQELYQQHPLLALSAFAFLIFLLTALSLPGNSLLMLAGGAVFGFPIALLVVSFADMLGSAAAFLLSRYLFRESLQARYGDRFRVVNRGIEEEGGFYLFSLRLMPLFPCFLINLLMGLTKLRLLPFCWITQVGKLPHNALYVNAGTQFGQINTLAGIISPEVIASLILLGVFPLIARKALSWHKRKGPDVCWLDTVNKQPQPEKLA